jgi:hypothetical protein
MNVRRWGAVLRLFHGYPQPSHKQKHGQRFGAINAAPLRGKRLNSLHRFTLELSEGRNVPFGRKRPRSACRSSEALRLANC